MGLFAKLHGPPPELLSGACAFFLQDTPGPSRHFPTQHETTHLGALPPLFLALSRVLYCALRASDEYHTRVSFLVKRLGNDDLFLVIWKAAIPERPHCYLGFFYTWVA